MKIRQLSIFEFDNFATNHPLGSYHQTSSYALFQSEQGKDYDLLGLINEKNEIIAASLIIIKKLNIFFSYGYAPKGFLMNYYDERIVKEFSTLLKKHYYNKNVAFIKINPEIEIGQIDFKNKSITYNRNKNIISTLKKYDYIKLNTNKLFETKLPNYNSIVLLKNYDFKKLAKNTRNKIHKSKDRGIYLEKGKRDDIKILYEFFKLKKDRPLSYYINYYNAFSKKDAIDIFLLKIDFENCLITLREKYEKELELNNKLNEKVLRNATPENLKRKMASDKNLNNYNQNIAIATRNLAEHKELIIGGCITIKYKNRINILISSYDKKFKHYSPNYYLHYALLEQYKEDYDFIDLNGITGDFSNENPYKGLNEFKQGFNPLSFEYIGEFDFIINPGLYKSMEENGILAKEFNKKQKNINPKD